MKSRTKKTKVAIATIVKIFFSACLSLTAKRCAFFDFAIRNLVLDGQKYTLKGICPSFAKINRIKSWGKEEILF